MNQSWTRCAVAAVLSCAAASAGVVTVDASGGADFLDLPLAVVAAQDGDTVLIEDGVYSGFELDGKSLTIAAVADSAEVHGAIQLRNIGPNSRVNLIGLSVLGATALDQASQGEGYGLLAVDCAGALRIVDSQFTGASGVPVACSPFCGPQSDGWDAVRLTQCASVAFRGCHTRGGTGGEGIEYYGHGGRGGAGLLFSDSEVAAYDSQFVGESGAYGGQQGGRGGAGVHALSGRLLVSNSSAEGGAGGYADDFFFAAGGDGGDGVLVESSAELFHLESEFAGGAGGPSTVFPQFNGAPGVPIASAGVVTPFPGSAGSLRVNSVVAAGNVATFEFGGNAGTLAFLLFNTHTTHQLSPQLQGTLLVAAPSFVFVGVIPPSESIVLDVPLGPLVGPGGSLLLTMQSVFAEPAGAVTLGSWDLLNVVGL